MVRDRWTDRSTILCRVVISIRRFLLAVEFFLFGHWPRRTSYIVVLCCCCCCCCFLSRISQEAAGRVACFVVFSFQFYFSSLFVVVVVVVVVVVFLFIGHRGSNTETEITDRSFRHLCVRRRGEEEEEEEEVMKMMTTSLQNESLEEATLVRSP